MPRHSMVAGQLPAPAMAPTVIEPYLSLGRPELTTILIEASVYLRQNLI